MTIFRSFCAALLLAFSIGACANDSISIDHAWVRATVPGQQVAAAYMDIKSTTDTALVRVESNLANRVEIHSMTMEHDIMKMRKLEELELPAGKTVSLAPGSYHLMLFDLIAPLAAGRTGKFKLYFRDGSTLSATLPIQDKATNNGDPHSHEH